MDDLLNQLTKTKEASYILGSLDTNTKNNALLSIKEAILNNIDLSLKQNQIDIDEASMLSLPMINRLTLTKEKLIGIAKSIEEVVKLHDPINEVISSNKMPNGLIINKVRVPFGVICCIFESRPNVLVDIACLTLKTGNACVLKGGKEAYHTNLCLSKIIKEAIKDYVPIDSVLFVESNRREDTLFLLKQKQFIDLAVPRGGKSLINFVVSNSMVPYIETGAGVCHIFLNDDYDFELALDIIDNAKRQNPSVCNSVETLLVHPKIANEFLPMLQKRLNDVLLIGCEKTCRIIDCQKTSLDNYYTEYNDLILNVLVCDLDEAIKHIRKYSTGHSESILSNKKDDIIRFMNSIDSACVYNNASTRFTDSGCFGMCAELGISTQKLHARGPMGLNEMTSYKYQIFGQGQIRK